MNQKPNDEALISSCEKLIQTLRKKNWTISFAESVTAGGFMHYFTKVAGTSEVFKGGIVTYTNEIKTDVLGVSPDTIETYGVVSKETAIEMANKIREMMGTSLGVGVTGYAGPGGGDEFAPVGRIYIGYVAPDGEDVFKFDLKGEREEIRYELIMKGITGILKNVLFDI